MKKIRYHPCVVFLITISILSIPTSATLSTIRETKTNTHDIVRTVTPHSNVQEVINQAPSGSTILFEAGTYTDILTIDKPLTLRGAGRDTTFIITESAKNSYALLIKSPNVTITEFTISNYGPGLYTTGIKISASHVTITDCIIKQTPVGIANWGSYNTIKNCNFLECLDEGILLVGTYVTESAYNLIKNCIFKYNGDGIEAVNTHNNRIENCTFSYNSHDGISFIGNSKTNYANTVINCIFNNNEVHGIYLSGIKNRILDNQFIDNGDGNIFLSPSARENIINYEGLVDSLQSLRRPFQNLIQLFHTFIQRITLRK